MNELLKESLLVCDYFLAYQRALANIAKRTTARRVRSRKLDILYERLAIQVEKVRLLQRRMAESN